LTKAQSEKRKVKAQSENAFH